MFTSRVASGLLLLAISSCRPVLGQRFEWSVASPQEVGLSDEGIRRMQENLGQHSTDSLLLVRHDKICCEWYSEGRDRPHYTASLAKALVGGMSLVVALSDGLLAVDDPAAGYIAAWRGDPTRAGITLRHLATHSSGIEDAEVKGMGFGMMFLPEGAGPATVVRPVKPG